MTGVVNQQAGGSNPPGEPLELVQENHPLLVDVLQNLPGSMTELPAQVFQEIITQRAGPALGEPVLGQEENRRLTYFMIE